MHFSTEFHVAFSQVLCHDRGWRQEINTSQKHSSSSPNLHVFSNCAKSSFMIDNLKRKRKESG